MGTNRFLLQVSRRLFPRLVWSGAGVIARKSYFERGNAGEGWIPMVPGQLELGWVSGTVPPRWVLVVTDSGGKEHAVAVASDVWASFDVGDVVNADKPLIDID